MSEAGYEVVVIAPHERDGKVNEIRTRAVPKPEHRLVRMTRTTWQIFRTALNEKPDICHFHDPELIPVGLLLRLLGKRVVYDAHEDVPKQIFSKHWISPILRRGVAQMAAVMEITAALVFDAIVAATPAIAKRFPSKKTVVVQNFPVVDKQPPAPVNSYASRPPVLAYVGVMTGIRGIKEMAQAIALVPARLRARLVLVGSFDPELEPEIQKMQTLDCVEVLGWQSEEGVRELLGQARAGLVLFHPVPNHMEAQPNKLFEYMHAGIPVVASDFPLWRDIVNGAACGLLVDPLDPKAIAYAIQWLLEHPTEADAMGARGKCAIQNKFNWNGEGEKLLGLYEAISGSARAGLQDSQNPSSCDIDKASSSSRA